MLCEKCGVNSATTHIRTMVNGVYIEKHFCSYCAAKEGYGEIKGNDISQILSSMFGEGVSSTSQVQVARCEGCGATFTDITESGKCGCSKCYDTFKEQLLPYIKKAQYGRVTHKGKIPNTVTNFQKPSKEKIEELKLLLNKLIKEEQFEQAALIRDRIKLLEGEMQ